MKNKNRPFFTRMSVIVHNRVYIQVLGNELSNTIYMVFCVNDILFTRAHLSQENIDAMNARPIMQDYIIKHP